MCEEREATNAQLQREKDEVQVAVLEKNTAIKTLLLKIEELEMSNRSVDLLDLIPQQQPKEVSRLLSLQPEILARS